MYFTNNFYSACTSSSGGGGSSTGAAYACICMCDCIFIQNVQFPPPPYVYGRKVIAIPTLQNPKPDDDDDQSPCSGHYMDGQKRGMSPSKKLCLNGVDSAKMKNTGTPGMMLSS